MPSCLQTSGSSGGAVTDVTATYPTFADCKGQDSGGDETALHTYWLDHSVENSGLLPDLTIADANSLMLALLVVLVLAWGYRVLARAL